MQELRIVSLISSATEIVHALGLGQFQVGRSHECDYPACVARLPVCTNPTIAVSGSSSEIDRLVKERLSSAASVYQVDSDLIRRLHPTHIITQTQCKVCAVSLEDVQRAFKTEIAINARIICLEPYALNDLWRDIRCVASGCRRPGAGEALTTSLQTRMRQIQERANATASKPGVAAIEWLEPLMAAGNWVPELIEMAGGKNLFGVAGAHSPWMNWDQLAAADPDVIIALPCGFDLSRTRAEMHWLSHRADWEKLRAVRQGRVFVCDGNQFMNRPGPRLAESLQIFAEILYPDLFAAQLEHVAWERF
ncbi:MAG: cobalamin-binding protein [Bryobacteraceae bacterium]